MTRRNVVVVEGFRAEVGRQLVLMGSLIVPVSRHVDRCSRRACFIGNHASVRYSGEPFLFANQTRF